jgi:hypothetical protein
MHAYNPATGYIQNPNFSANGVPGQIVVVRTNLNSPVMAWRPLAPIPVNPNHRFFCHGYSLGTYFTHGYSVLSGVEMLIVLADEYVRIGYLDSPHVQANDVLVMWHGRTEIRHSAKIVNRVLAAGGGGVNDGLTLLNSKTGTGPLKLGVSLATVKQDYRDLTSFEVYRPA